MELSSYEQAAAPRATSPGERSERWNSEGIGQWVAERPWVAFGTAVAAGYLLGRMGSDKPRFSQPGMFASMTESFSSTPRMHTSDFAHRYQGAPQAAPQRQAPMNVPHQQYASGTSMIPPQAREDLGMIAQATIASARHWIRDTIRQNVPSMSSQIEELEQRQSPQGPARNPSGTNTSLN